MSHHEHTDTCGCCEGVTSLTPQEIWNRPGLDSLAYRVGTHATFKESMIAALARGRARLLTTRDDDDPSIALLDAWAAALDVLTFYQERIANEGYLRTATETRSLAELASAIGYRFGPGVAATALLSFEVDATPGAPESVQLEPGVKVQTTPGQDEKPQLFETTEAIEARAAWNAVAARTEEPHLPGVGARRFHLRGILTDLRPGDLLLVVGRARRTDPGSEDWDVHVVRSVALDDRRGVTTVDCDAGLATGGVRSSGPAPLGVSAFVLRQRASIFGHNAPDWRSLPLVVKRGYVTSQAAQTAIDAALAAGAVTTPAGTTGVPTEWPFQVLTPDTTDTIDLDTVYPKVVAGGWVVLAGPPGVELYRIVGATEAARADYTLTGKTTRLKLSGESLSSYGSAVRTTAVYAQSEPVQLAPAPVVDPVQGDVVDLAGRVDGIAEGRLVIVAGKRPRVTVAAEASGVELRPATGAAVALSPGESLTVVAPFTQTGSTRTWKVRRADDTTGTVTASPDDVAVTAALDGDPEISEAAVVELSRLEPSGATTLRLAAALTQTYDRASARVLANVARAGHGETTSEVLGSGEGWRAFQRFALKQAPLTHVPAATPSGSETTLEVRVDDVAWDARPSLLGAGAEERVYVTESRPDEPEEVVFGDGVTGSRVPSRTANVIARYRVGTGVAGNVRAGQLNVLMTRPLGLSAVRNPLPATGGADPDRLEDVRRNAPKTVKAFERVVSLSDFEDFAQAFAGVAKAKADWVWNGRRRMVHLTVAGPRGDAIEPAGPTFPALRAALAKQRDGRAPFVLASYDAVPFEVAAGVYVAPGHEWKTVRAAVEAALRSAFAFDARELGQAVSESEVVAVIQAVRGVEGVALDHLRTTAGAAVDAVVVAESARLEDGILKPAQLVLLAQESTAVVLSEREP